MSPPLNVALLGATGSVGRQALDVIDRNPGRFAAYGLVSGVRAPGREARFSIRAGEPDFDARLEELVTHPDVDIVLVAIPGARALRPTLAALRAHKKIALASKEVLVMAGGLVMAAAAEPDSIRPVDSEHSAIWQCLWGEAPGNVARLLLTASGGPFWSAPELNLAEVSVEQALRHPSWSMGPKVSIDSATLMNKGLELIEAARLFQVGVDQVQVVVHPQSVIHSLVEFVDGSAKAQLGNPDMRLPIGLALAYPDRLPGAVPPTSFERLGSLELHPLDNARFPAVELARSAARTGGGHPAVLNAANEQAVEAFLAGELRFSGIVSVVESALAAFQGSGDTLEEVIEADRWARDYAASQVGIYRK